MLGKLTNFMWMLAIWYTQLKDQMVSLSPDHQQKLREKELPTHIHGSNREDQNC
jgi:hypothetical protein